MSMTLTKLHRLPRLDQALTKIDESHRKRLKVLRASMQKRDRNEVKMALRQHREQKALETAKELLEDRVYELKYKNEEKSSKVHQKKLKLELKDEKRRRELKLRETQPRPVPRDGNEMSRTLDAKATADDLVEVNNSGDYGGYTEAYGESSHDLGS